MIYNKRLAVVRTPVKPAPSLSEQAYQAIKDRILALELRPGQFVNELALSQALKMSRMPVHQAVHRLHTEGLLEIIPRKGIIIGSGSLNEMMQLLEARAAVEPNIAALAAERAGPEQVKELEKLLRQAAKLVDQRYRREFMAIDRTFHQAVSEAAGNRILTEAQRPLHERSARIWDIIVMQSAPDGLRMTQEEHEAVFDGIRRGDRDAARRTMQAHLASLKRRINPGSDR